MTLSTLATDSEFADKRRLTKGALVSLGFTAFSILFNAIYTHYSYGITSEYLQYVFLLPLLGGTVPYFLFRLFRASFITRIGFNLWNAALATAAMGSLVRAIVNISGRFTDHEKEFYIAAGVLAVLAIFSNLFTCFFAKRRKETV